jgi:hypothetical protein
VHPRPRPGAPGGGPGGRPLLPLGHDGVAANYDPVQWRNRATEEQKRIGWEMWVRMDKIMCTVLREAHERQIEETMDALADGQERFYETYLD